MKRFLPVLPCLLFFLNTAGQNLVPNPSFEKANRKPAKNQNSINRCSGWMAPIAYSDYYVKGSDWQVGTPRNVFGTQKPRTGNAYAGICMRTKFLEYLETKLLDTLEKDREYLIELYISRAERSIGSVSEFGVWFTNYKVWGLQGRGIPEKPQITFTSSKGYKNKKQWTKLTGAYVAEGNESVMIFGHFNYDSNNKSRLLYAHYYVDDVSITLIKPQSDSTVPVVEETQNAPEFSPEPGETITLNNVFFQTNKSELLPGSFPELNKLARYLSDRQEMSIKISGHTDNTGNEKQNVILSETRARSVANYLSSKGIDPERITFTGYGSSKPLSTNETEAGKQKNRRVEFVITGN